MEISSTINEVVAASRQRGELESAFAEWQQRHEALRATPYLDDLIELCRRAPRCLYPQKNDALRALCLEAAGGDELAGALLLWLLLPALLGEWKRIDRHDALSPEDLEAELMVGFWESVTWIRPTSRKVAARLVQGARRRAIAAVKRESSWVGATELVVPPDDVAASNGMGPDPLAALSEAVRQRAISSMDVEALLATPEGLKVIASRDALTIKAVRLRRGRARERLLAWLDGDRRSSNSAPAGPSRLAVHRAAPSH